MLLSRLKCYAAAATVAIAMTAVSCSTSAPEELPYEMSDTLSIVEQRLLFDLPMDSFIIENGKVARRENLSHILLRAGLSYADVYEAADKALPMFDFRSIRAGNTYTLFFAPDSLHRLRHFVYSIDEMTYIRCSFVDSTTVSLNRRAVHIEERTAAAVITSSLWVAAAEHGLSPTIALELSDIFAWAVDFFGIEKGDYFKVVYSENCIDSTAIGLDRIKAALFVHKGKPYYAFYYTQDSTSSYFDLEGYSLRRAFLKAPLKYSRISSRFSNGRMHPILKIRRPHHGVDYAAPAGTPVYTIGDGQIIAKGWDKKGGGNYVKIKHNSTYTSVYMHLRGFAKGIATGKHVKQGDLIGFVGATGLATGPHLDFRIYKNNKAVNPLTVDAPPTEPVNNDNIQDFMNYSDSLRAIIDAIELNTEINE